MENEKNFIHKVNIFLNTPSGFQTLKIIDSIIEIGFTRIDKENNYSFLKAIDFFEGFKFIEWRYPGMLPIKTEKSKLLIGTKKIPDAVQGYDIIEKKSLFSLKKMLDMLISMGFERVDYVEKPGEFSQRGGILDIFPIAEEHPVRIEFWDDKVNSLRMFREDTQRTIQKVNRLFVPGKSYSPNIVEIIPKERGESDIFPLELVYKDFNELISKMNHYLLRDYRVYFYTVEKERGKRYSEILPAEVKIGLVEEGFVDEKKKIAVFTELMLFPLYRKKRKVKHTRTEIKRTFQRGEYVVHLDYGIARFEGIIRCKAFGKEYDCVRLKFKDGTLDVPTHNLYLVERFNVDVENVKLSSLSQETWKKKRIKVQIKAYKLAREILEIHAKRKQVKRPIYRPFPEIEERVALDFPYIETDDQKKAIRDVLSDLENTTLMDRLIAGDVGFGKTEVAIRACARVVANSKQVLILVPTTPLALQHYKLFKSRLEKYGLNIKMASRFVSKRNLEKIRQEVEDGTCDILISTHNVLRRNIHFKNIGLLIIDEEHKFGVKDKEVLRMKYPGVDTLRLTATPIPRTLNMSLGRIYDLSVIETPPAGREEIETHVGPIDDKLIKQALRFELDRGGKVFYIHNRIRNLLRIEERIRRLLPDVKLKIAHGRLSASKLEKILLDFYEGETEILLSTAIMEAGVDFPKANTIIIENAHLFGLADLHQLRGRVGRSNSKGYAYFLVPRNISHKAIKRLNTIKRYHHLGAGFQIALKDMEIRGAGNLLGKEQHGFIQTVGPSMFFKLLEMAINELEGTKNSDIELIFKIPSYIPESYIKDDTTRIGFYTQISEAKNIDDLSDITEELKDRFGEFPPELEEFLYGIKLKILLSRVENVKIIIIEHNTVKIQDNKQNSIRFRKLPCENLTALYLELRKEP